MTVTLRQVLGTLSSDREHGVCLRQRRYQAECECAHGALLVCVRLQRVASQHLPADADACRAPRVTGQVQAAELERSRSRPLASEGLQDHEPVSVAPKTISAGPGPVSGTAVAGLLVGAAACGDDVDCGCQLGIVGAVMGTLLDAFASVVASSSRAISMISSRSLMASTRYRLQ